MSNNGEKKKTNGDEEVEVMGEEASPDKADEGTSAKKKRAPTKTKKKRAPTKKKRARTKTKAPSVPVTVVVREQTKSHHQRARDVVESLGYQLAPEEGSEEIAARISGDQPPDVVIAGIPGGEALFEACRARAKRRPVTIAAISGSPTSARERAEEAGADLFVIRPHNREGIAAALCAASVVELERSKTEALEVKESVLQERLQRYGQADAITGFQHFDFFKQLLVMELKRAKRYGYSLAACLVAFDPWPQDRPEPPETLVSKLRTRVAAVITACIRDIDLPVDYADDRFLVFLPYTDLAGAEHVGKRVAKAVKSFGTMSDTEGREWTVSVSVGIAAVRPGKPISFARIMRDASAAVRASQLKGGGQVVVRK